MATDSSDVSVLQERNFSDHHVTGIKEEYEDHSQDLTSQIKFEEHPVPISFPVEKREPEEEQSNLDTVNEEARVEVAAEGNEVSTERIGMPTKRKSSESVGIVHVEKTIVCQILNSSGSSEKPVGIHEDEKQLEIKASEPCFSKSSTEMYFQNGLNIVWPTSVSICHSELTVLELQATCKSMETITLMFSMRWR
ncbi:uncharacterized protein [Periplaneta americana]|uniref:uncharacterized protein n=1 Tax=Periplaneta americana TaxID=6978 RepID=UPI0037E704F2